MFFEHHREVLTIKNLLINIIFVMKMLFRAAPIVLCWYYTKMRSSICQSYNLQKALSESWYFIAPVSLVVISLKFFFHSENLILTCFKASDECIMVLY
jgi:hypothetical protein